MEETISICEQQLKNDQTLSKRTEMSADTITQRLRFCLMSTAFQYDSKHYKQLDGIAMGSLVSPVIADIFMDELERKAFSNYCAVPRMIPRFVDDIITVIKKTQSQQLLQHLNNQNARFQFTMEEEANGTLPFMDIRFSRVGQGTITTGLSETDTYQPLSPVYITLSDVCELWCSGLSGK